MAVEVVALPDKVAALAEVAALPDKLAAAAEEAADLPADSPDNREAATASREVAAADMEGDVPGGRAIYNNHSPFPTTSRRLVESKPIDSKRRTNSLPPRTPA